MKCEGSFMPDLEVFSGVFSGVPSLCVDVSSISTNFLHLFCGASLDLKKDRICWKQGGSGIVSFPEVMIVVKV